MKKIMTTLAVAAAMFAFVACSSPADKAVKYCEEIAAAEEKGDYEKVEKLQQECEEWMKSLDEEEAKEALEAAAKWAIGNMEW